MGAPRWSLRRYVVVLAIALTPCLLRAQTPEVLPALVPAGQAARPQPRDVGSLFHEGRTIALEDALRLAGLENPTIGLAEETIRRSEAEATMARALLFPSLNAGTTLTLHQGTLLNSQGVVRDLERESLFLGAGADVRGAGPVAIPGVQLVSHLGDAVFAPRVARHRVVSSILEAQATRNQVLLQVARAYLALAGAEARVLALRQSLGELGELAELTAHFAEKGQGRAGDAQRARSEELLLEVTERRAEEEVAFWSAELGRLLSVDPSCLLRSQFGSPPLLELVDLGLPLHDLVQRALAQRPDLAARDADVALRETRLRQERLRPLLPTLAVGFSAGDFGGGSSLVPYHFSRWSSRTDVAVQAVWSVQNLGFGNRAVNNRARSEVGQAEAERLRTIDAIRREVAEALAQATARRLHLDIARRRAATAQQGFHQDLLRAKNLQGRLLEVLDSAHQLTAARQELVRAMVGYSQAQFDLYVALGNTVLAATR